MTAERSRVFLNSQVLGILPTRFAHICMFKRDNGTYECDCVAYWHYSVECAHSYVAMDLVKFISVEDILEAIPHRKRMGAANLIRSHPATPHIPLL